MTFLIYALVPDPFLAFGIIPGFYFGSYGTLVLLNHLFGGPLEATALVRSATAFGILIGITCVGSVTSIVGAICGTVVVGYAIEAVANTTKREMPADKALTETKPQ